MIRLHKANATNRIRSVAYFWVVYLSWSCLELVFSWWQFSRGMTSHNADLIKKALLPIIQQLFTFGIQFALCLLLLAIASEFIRSALRMRSKNWVAVYLILLSLLYNLSQTPQIFGYSVPKIAFQLALPFWIALAVLPPTVLIIRQVMNPSTLGANFRLGNFAAYSILLGSIAIFSIMNTRSVSWWDKFLWPKKLSVSENSVLVLSIDSLRPDFVDEYVLANPNSELAKIYRGSVRFSRIVTTVPKTHAALSSFLTGEIPEKNGVRDNLFPGFLDTDNLYSEKGLIRLFRSLNYSRSFILDETKFSYFKEGNSLSKVVSPPNSFMNILSTEVFRSNLFWSYFGNIIGHTVIPITKMNYAFSIGYRPKDFLNQIFQRLNEPGKQFLLAHTCALHYPAESRSPYLQRYQTDIEYVFTRYPNFFGRTEPTLDRAQSQFRNLAKGQFDLLADELIEPLLYKLRENGLLERLHLVIMSDHGETFWKPGVRYSRVPLPYHGQPALLDEDSHRMVALIHSPSLKPKVIESIQSITDLSSYIGSLPTLGTKQPVDLEPHHHGGLRYFESGMIGLGILNSILNFSSRIISDGYEMLEGSIGLQPEFSNGIIIQKARSVASNDRHWTFAATEFGVETTMCKDQACFAVTGGHSKDFNKVIDFLNASSVGDQIAGNGFTFENIPLPWGKVRINPAKRELSPEALWLKASHLLNVHGDFAQAVKLWLQVLESPSGKLDAKYRALLSLKRACELAPDSETCRTFFNWLELERALPESQSFLSQLSAASREWRRVLSNLKLISKELPESSDQSDPFVLAFQSILKKGNRDAWRAFIQQNRASYFMENTLYRRLWARTTAANPADIEAARKEVGDVLAHFKEIIQMGYFEPHVAWLQFTYDYWMLTGFDVFTKDARAALDNGMLPFYFAVSFVIPRLLNQKAEAADKFLKCYREEMLGGLIKMKLKATLPWSRQFLKAAELSTLCSA